MDVGNEREVGLFPGRFWRAYFFIRDTDDVKTSGILSLLLTKKVIPDALKTGARIARPCQRQQFLNLYEV